MTNNNKLKIWMKTKPVYSLDELSGVGEDFCEGRTKDNRILPFAVLYHVIGNVEKVQAVIVVG